jgi:hypothetical protein
VPQTQSNFSSAFKKAGTSRGSFCKSESSVIMMRPRAALMPAQSAADWPQWRASLCPRMSGSRVAHSFKAAQEASVLPSSVTMIS